MIALEGRKFQEVMNVADPKLLVDPDFRPTVRAKIWIGCMKVWSTYGAFLVQLQSGQFLAWGRRDHGADISRVKVQLELGMM